MFLYEKTILFYMNRVMGRYIFTMTKFNFRVYSNIYFY